MCLKQALQQHQPQHGVHAAAAHAAAFFTTIFMAPAPPPTQSYGGHCSRWLKRLCLECGAMALEELPALQTLQLDCPSLVGGGGEARGAGFMGWGSGFRV